MQYRVDAVFNDFRTALMPPQRTRTIHGCGDLAALLTIPLLFVDLRKQSMRK
jgi:hypothetical protein